ncbi:MAG TPA: hypothetical protein VLG66_13075 [Alphaproteobacteria bacterium]|nr:hypothetical protein [Alphaproteobacteria bacterium]
MRSIHKYVADARARASRRRSPWNLLLIPIGLFLIGSVWYLLVQGSFAVHRLFRPEEPFTVVPAWRMILMVVPLLFPAISIGLILANLASWCVPPARRAYDREAAGVSGASFRASLAGLGKLTAVLLPLAEAFSLVGAIGPD